VSGATGDRLAVSGDPYGNFGAVAALPKNTVGVAYRFGLGT